MPLFPERRTRASSVLVFPYSEQPCAKQRIVSTPNLRLDFGKDSSLVCGDIVLFRDRTLWAYGTSALNAYWLGYYLTERSVGTYTADLCCASTLLRTEKLAATRGADSYYYRSSDHDCVTPVDITSVYASDAADRMEHSARQVVAAVSVGDEADSLFAGVQRLTSHTTYNIVAARRRIADSVIKAGRYYL
jgi:hypothetical protein